MNYCLVDYHGNNMLSILSIEFENIEKATNVIDIVTKKKWNR